jgi:thiamine biosynthesis lipoprotein
MRGAVWALGLARTLAVAPAAADVQRRTHDAMGTIFTIAVGDAVSTEVVDEATREAFAEIDRIEALISEWRPSSEISLVNAAAGRGSVLVSPETYECVERGLALSRATDGAFDLTWAALRGLWKFGPESAPRLPSPEAVTAALARVGWRDIALNPKARTIALRRPGMALGLGGIGQGYGVSRAVVLLRARGLSRFIIDGGGDLYLAGEKAPGTPWTVGVQDPRDPARLTAEVTARDEAIITSGDYERFFELDGRRYHHIIDLRTGYPASESVSTTVFARDPTLADAFATACFVLGPRGCVAAAGRLQGVEAAVFTPDGRVVTTRGVRSRFPARWRSP